MEPKFNTQYSLYGIEEEAGIALMAEFIIKVVTECMRVEATGKARLVQQKVVDLIINWRLSVPEAMMLTHAFIMHAWTYSLMYNKLIEDIHTLGVEAVKAQLITDGKEDIHEARMKFQSTHN